MAYLKIKKIKNVADDFDTHLEISMVGLYNDDGTWIKWVRLSDPIVKQALIETKIQL